MPVNRHPFLLAAAAKESSRDEASLSDIVYEVVRANPFLLLVPQ